MIEENNDNWNTGKLEHPYGRGINLSMTVSNIEKMYEILKEKNSIIYSNIIDNKDWNGYGFKLENVEKLENIEVCGKLSFWEFDYPQICGKRKEG